MQSLTYRYDRGMLVIFAGLFFMCVGFSSMAPVATAEPQFPQSNTNNATLHQVKTFVSKGLSLLYSGKYNESITFFDKALGINPNDVSALSSKGAALLYSGKYNESITFFDKALGINPNDVSALTRKGAALFYSSK